MTYKRFKHIKISLKNIAEDIKPLMREVRPLWDISALKIKKMHGGVSNILFGVFVGDMFMPGETDMILVRIYGNLLLDRNVELVNMSALNKCDLSAPVLGQFNNGCCYQFIHGTMLDCNDVREPYIYKLIIQEFVKLHNVQLNICKPKKLFLFSKMKKAANHLPLFLENVIKNERYLNEYPSKIKVLKEIDELEKELLSLDCPVKFCHNDLLVRNMVFNLEKNRIHMIDFEYADYNYVAFDLGNHFCEFAGLDNTDYSLYPDKDFQKVWLRQYLELNRLANNNKSLVTDEEVNRWYRMTNKFALGSHLLWSVWSIWQEVNSCTEFDYLGYAIIRWNEYVSKKTEFFNL